MAESDVYKREEHDRPVERSPRGRYIRFDIRLGTGAYKTVYKAYDTDQGIDVAWNAIDIGLLPATEKTRIIQEVQLLQKLEHKNIINFYGSWFSKEKNQVVFITEIMTSGTLKSYIKRVQFVKWKIIRRWCIQILEGLHYLHSQQPPVIHRDLKCDNIFINGNTGDLRIGDLGLSTQLAVHKRSRAQSVLGTPEFMAPELYDESYDEKVDIYAFGMCVLEMVTKEVPYSECINPAQIYKKVTAGIRPKGLQRIVSQPAKDFIELCLSRGNGEIDVSAAYLLNHPFLKPQDDDGEMVQVLDEDALEREMKEQEASSNAVKSLQAELSNMESCAKAAGEIKAVESERRKQHPSLSMEPEELGAGSSTSGEETAVANDDAAQPLARIPSEGKAAGKHHVMMRASSVDGNSPPPPAPPSSSSLPPLAPSSTSSTADAVVTTAPDVVVDEPLSDKKDVDSHVDQFLATMPGSEIKIQNTRMNVMGGRGHRLELEDDQDQVTDEDTVESQAENGEQERPPQQPPPKQQDEEAAADVTARSASPVTEPPPASTETAAPSSNSSQDSSSGRTSRPQSASSSSSVTPPIRKRGKRHEIRAIKDPENEHSILLNLRIMIDGKSKEIKFPFNLFTDSTHEVACELAVDVGILEPDLEDIADSISFLVTEGKINNLPHVDEDVWDEAPEPHSFSSKPLPHVSKMSFRSNSNATASSSGTAPLNMERAQSISAFTLESQHHDSTAPAGNGNGNGGSGRGLVLAHDRPEATKLLLTADTNGSSAYPDQRTVRSPLRRGQIVHASSDTAIPTPDDWASSAPPSGNPMDAAASRERGISLGSTNDPNYIRKVRHFEDRMKIARSAFDERESSLEAAIRNEEEKHQREIERFRKKMQEFQEKKQRAAIARQERMKQVAEEFKAEVDLTDGANLSPPHPPFAGTEVYGQSPTRVETSHLPVPVRKISGADARPRGYTSSSIQPPMMESSPPMGSPVHDASSSTSFPVEYARRPS